MTPTVHSYESDPLLPRRRGLMLLGLAVWTLLVGLALWWLLRADHGPSVWIFRNGEPAQAGSIEKFHGLYKADTSLHRLYPWIFFGPYVALAALYFPLERGRLTWAVPVNLATCLAFIMASHAIDSRTRVTQASVVIVKSGHGNAGVGSTNTIQVRITSTQPSELRWGEVTRLMPEPQSPELSGSGVAGAELLDPNVTNLLAKAGADLKPPLPGPGLPGWSLWSTLLDLLAYGAVLGLAHSVHFYRRFREREHRALFLESNLATAQLHALQAQLQPHFLFNSLNAIATLLRRDPRLAESTLLSLSDLLRLALGQSDRQEVTLREELEFVERYLEIQQTRFGERLRFEKEIAPETLDTCVPTLLLQPLVENAIRHGIEPAENACLVRLTAHRRQEKLLLTVEDDGVGLAHQGVAQEGVRPTVPEDQGSARAGIGLRNLRARLETLYGKNQALELLSRPQGGVRVRVEIPWRSVARQAVSAGGTAS